MTSSVSPSIGQPNVLVVLALYRPNPIYLMEQLTSIAAQRDVRLRLVAVVADTLSGPLFEEQALELGLDYEIVHWSHELDAVRAFEAGISQAIVVADQMSGEDPLIALCDQDDVWHPDRLKLGIERLNDSGAQLVHSDARLVDADGTTELKASMFSFERRHRRPGLRGLLYRNNITGMTLLMRMSVARVALPFPAQSGVHFYHDLWLGLVAQATGGVELIKEPLVDYRQHGGNVMGAVDRETGWLRGLRGARLNTMWLRRESASYALARYLAQSLQTRLLDAVEDGRLASDAVKARTLQPYLRRSGGGLKHAFDALRLLVTGHAGLARIAGGFFLVNSARTVWSVKKALGPSLDDVLAGFDKRLFSLSPGVSPQSPKLSDAKTKPAKDFTSLAETRKKPSWQMEFSTAAPALNILVPTLNPTEVFAGIVTAVDIGLGLATLGYNVRFIATDLPISSAVASRGFLLQRLSGDARATGAGDRVSLHCGIQQDTVPAHSGDLFLATAWWSAHIAHELISDNNLDQEQFYYLIQDFEPNFYPWGSEFADASASYELNFVPIFNTTLLRDYFALQGYGFAANDALAFHPAIDIDSYATNTRPGKSEGPRRLALYGRPEVARNMYPSAIEALAEFIEAEQLGPEDIELVSVGLAHAPVSLPRGLQLKSLGKLPYEQYPSYLCSVDLGLSLMYSPHPSHPPIEMAASGVRVVTNEFGPKVLSELTTAIFSANASTPSLVEALRKAWRAPPVTQSERNIDLSQLGLGQSEMLHMLSEEIGAKLPKSKDNE
ncbi:glycosyl transferase family 1 [Tateyamaria sp.]|uniref:rhamnosyltransferase WsaF family glycosyltransferase n=1 Tax=Tateyamaria sp. TaxID=1929288 RepID=UPI00329F1E75